MTTYLKSSSTYAISAQDKGMTLVPIPQSGISSLVLDGNIPDIQSIISGKADISSLSSKADISSVPTISVDGVPSDIGFLHVSDEEYNQILEDGPLSNVLYLVSSEYNNAYGMQIKNLSAGTDLSDAVNLEQVTQISSSIYQHFDGLIGNLESLINSL